MNLSLDTGKLSVFSMPQNLLYQQTHSVLPSLKAISGLGQLTFLCGEA